MTNAIDSEPKWAIEVEREGKGVEYYAIEAMVVNGSHLCLQSASGAAIEFARDSIRKILVMRTNIPSE